MPQSLTRYNLLISRPNDANEEAKIARECIELTNSIYSDESEVFLNPIDWTNNSYADSGDQPQALLNKQLVDKADIVIAIFKERYGTPTKEYESGTEEEILLALEEGKRVMLYCLSSKGKSSLGSNEQWEKIENLKERVRAKVLYKEYDDIESLRKILNHDFGRLVFELENLSKTSADINVSICSINEDNLKTQNLVYLQNPMLIQKDRWSSLVSKIKNKVEEINRISDIMVSEHTNKESSQNGDMAIKGLGDAISFKFSSINLGSPTKIEDEDKATVVKTLNRLQIEIPDTFFELGNLAEMQSAFSAVYGNIDYFGSDSEKEKHKQILSLVQICELANQLYDYEKNACNEHIVGFAICNKSNVSLTHINIELRFPAGSVIKPDGIASPGSIVLKAQEDKWANNYFLIRESEDFLPYEKTQKLSESGRKSPYTFVSQPIEFLGRWSYPAFDEGDLREQLNVIFDDYCFVFGNNCNQDIVRVQMDYLQHGNSYGFPAYILLNKKVEKIIYKVTVDEYPQAIEGELFVSG